MMNKEESRDRVVIFDLDGTLIDSDRQMSRELIETFKGLGVPITEEEAGIDGKRDKYRLASKYGFSSEDLDRSYGQNVKDRYALDNVLRSGEVTLYPETLRILDSLRNGGVVLGLLPRATRERDVAHKVEYFGLQDYFGDRIVVVPADQDTKYQGALNLLGKIRGNVSKVFCIGDRAEDVVISDGLRTKDKINAEGIYVHRLDSPDIELARYKKVKSLDEIPDLVLPK